VLREDLAWLTGDRHRVVIAVTIKIVVPLLEKERDPTDLALGKQELELRVALEVAVEDEVKQRVGRIVRLRV